MIRRPLPGMAVSLVLGMIGYSLNKYLLVLLALMLECLLLLSARYNPQCFIQYTKEDWHRFLWPVFFLVGAFSMSKAMQPQKLELALQDIPMQCAMANILDICQKDNSWMLSVGDVRVYDEEHQVWYEGRKGIVYSKEVEHYAIGNELFIEGTIQGLTKATNPGQFDEYTYYRVKDVTCKIYADRITVTDHNTKPLGQIIYQAKRRLTKQLTMILPVKEAGLLSAILFGDKELLMDEVKELYRENGLLHIMAVSGLHISLLGYGLYRLLRRLTVPILCSALISIAFLICYAMMAGFSVSTQRAVIMFIIMMLGDIIGKSYDMLSALSFAVIIILLLQPLELFQATFQFSFVAVLGISVLYPVWKEKLIEHTRYPMGKRRKALCEAFLFSGSIQLMTIPLTCYYYFELPLYAVFINLLILPLCSILVFASLTACILSFFSLWLGDFFVGGAYYLLQVFEGILSIPEHLPYHLILIGRPSSGFLLGYYLVLYATYRLCQMEKTNYSMFLLSLLLLFLRTESQTGISVYFLDVSQGDCAILTFDGKVVMIDGGSSNVNQVYEYRIKPFLKCKGIRHIDVIAISHADLDHVSGICECIQQMKHYENTMMNYNGELTIGSILLPKLSSYDENYQEIIHLVKEKEIPRYHMGQGDTVEYHGLTLTALSPQEAIEVENRNNTSLVLMTEYQEFDGIFLGDIDSFVEKEILNRYNKKLQTTEIEVLKIAHHGSKNASTDELLETIRPELAVISAGRNNRYGHPHPEVLDRLTQAKIPVVITKENGYIERNYK